MRLISLVTLFTLSAACVAEPEDATSPLAEREYDSPGPNMQAGENCMSCHIKGGTAQRVQWTAAGTVYAAADADYRDGVSGATVILVDAMGKEVRLTSNEVGNFYTLEPLVQPYTVRLEYEGRIAAMPIQLDSLGACAGCHSAKGRSGALGRIRIPPAPAM